MSKSNVVEFSGPAESADPLTELLRQGARDLIQKAVEAELAEYLESFQGRRLEDGRAAVVRNGNPVSFRSALVPPYVRKTRSLEAALP